METQKQWIGVEVEGRLSGMRTLFQRAVPADFAACHKLPHIFIDHFFDFADPRWQEFRAFLATEYAGMVTLSVELYKLNEAPHTYGHELLNRAHIMVVIDCPALLNLKPTDTVKLTWAPYRARSFIWECGQLVEPQHYAADVIHP